MFPESTEEFGMVISSFFIVRIRVTNNVFSMTSPVISPIFILRMGLHPALAGHWLLLITLYLSLTKSYKNSKISWIFIITLASLVHWYFTVIISITFVSLRVLNFLAEKEKIIDLVKDFAITFLSLFLVMYCAGYFEVRTVDGLGLGYGEL